MAWPTSIASATPGTEGAAADFNNHRDALNALGSAWTSYTPAITAATTNPTLGSTSVSGFYRKIGKTVDIDIDITIGSGFSAGSGAYRFSFPAGVSPLLTAQSRPLGLVHVRDVSVPATTTHNAYYFSSSVFAVVASGGGGLLGASSPITWASGDIISIHIAAMQIS